jgi:hypothetical protein
MRPFLAATMWFLSVAGAFSQYETFRMTGRTSQTRAEYTFEALSGPRLSITIGAPYSGREIRTSVRRLADGTVLTRSFARWSMVYRDSRGRLRVERPAFPASDGAAPNVVEIQDPVAGYRYILDMFDHIAHRAPFKPEVIREAPVAPAGSVGPYTRTDAGGGNTRIVPLGADTISGVPVDGTRTEVTYPPGSRMGNDRPFTVITEKWSSPHLGIVLLSKQSDPNNETTIAWNDFIAAEPDSELFQIPAGYQIIDETGPFKIVIPR